MSDCLDSKSCTNCKGTGLLTSFRTMDGTCNRLLQPLVGAAMTKHQRFLGKIFYKYATAFGKILPCNPPCRCYMRFGVNLVSTITYGEVSSIQL